MSNLTSALVKTIKAAAGFVPDVNHRAIEFLCHYVEGTQTPMKLTEEEIELTKEQVLAALKWGQYNPETRKGWVSCPSNEWLTHPTAGVVGGFLFEVVGEGFSLVCKCWDDWDFNLVKQAPSHLVVPSSVPPAILAAGRVAAKAMGVKMKVNHEGVYILEDDLVQFNDKHRFRTEWEFEISHWDLIPDEEEEE